VARLGATTTTGDAEGEVVRERPVVVTGEDVARVRALFVGPLQQVPPMYSALKKDGRPLYEYARAGIDVERAARQITVHDLVMAVEDDGGGGRVLRMVVRCSKGTYIRTLAEDIGEALGCGAHLIGLRRVATGNFGVAQSVGLERLAAMSEEQRVACLLPVDALLADHAVIELGPEDAGRFLSGVRRRGHWANCEKVAVFGTDPRALLGSGHVAGGELIPGRLLSPIEITQTLVAR
jgi:tRNA pseudouridine55 synthase